MEGLNWTVRSLKELVPMSIEANRLVGFAETVGIGTVAIVVFFLKPLLQKH